VLLLVGGERAVLYLMKLAGRGWDIRGKDHDEVGRSGFLNYSTRCPGTISVSLSSCSYGAYKFQTHRGAGKEASPQCDMIYGGGEDEYGGLKYTSHYAAGVIGCAHCKWCAMTMENSVGNVGQAVERRRARVTNGVLKRD
jgi:hypothetical protein